MGLAAWGRVKGHIRASLSRGPQVISYSYGMLYVHMKALLPTCHCSLLPSLFPVDHVEHTICSSVM